MTSPRQTDADGRKRLKVSYVHDGRSEEIEVEVSDTPDPEDEQRAEAAHFVQTLADNGQLDGPGSKYEIVSKPDGTKALRPRPRHARLVPHR